MFETMVLIFQRTFMNYVLACRTVDHFLSATGVDLFNEYMIHQVRDWHLSVLPRTECNCRHYKTKIIFIKKKNNTKTVRYTFCFIKKIKETFSLKQQRNWILNTDHRIITKWKIFIIVKILFFKSLMWICISIVLVNTYMILSSWL